MEYIKTEHYDHVRNGYGREMVIPSEREWAEVKHGRWMPNLIDKDIRNGLYFFCSECGEEMPPSEVFYPYCPNCGADMRGGQDE